MTSFSALVLMRKISKVSISYRQLDWLTMSHSYSQLNLLVQSDGSLHCITLCMTRYFGVERRIVGLIRRRSSVQSLYNRLSQTDRATIRQLSVCVTLESCLVNTPILLLTMIFSS